MIRYAIKKNIWCYSKFGETIPSSKLTHVFLQKSCMFLVIESSLSPKFWRILRGHSATPEQSTLNPQDCRNKLMDSTVLDRLFLKICLPSIKRIICVFFPGTHSLPTIWANCFEIHIQSHTLIELSKDQGISGHVSILEALPNGTLSLRSIPSHKWSSKTIENRTLKVQQTIHWIWKRRV